MRGVWEVRVCEPPGETFTIPSGGSRGRALLAPLSNRISLILCGFSEIIIKILGY